MTDHLIVKLNISSIFCWDHYDNKFCDEENHFCIIRTDINNTLKTRSFRYKQDIEIREVIRESMPIGEQTRRPYSIERQSYLVGPGSRWAYMWAKYDTFS